MSEHGWPDFHDDHGGDHGHDDGGLHHDDADALVPPHDDVDVPLHHEDDDGLWQHDEPAEVHDDAPSYEHHAEEVAAEPEDQPWTAPEHDMGPVGADPDALDAHVDPDPVDMFPQVVDVGPLPEPVDGFPWIDTGSLGVVDAHAVEAHDAEVTPQELAEYAGADLPPGADPWAALADAEDPATSTLARWWSEQQQ